MLGKARLDTGLKRGITRNEVAQLAGRFHFTPAYLQMLRLLRLQRGRVMSRIREGEPADMSEHVGVDF